MNTQTQVAESKSPAVSPTTAPVQYAIDETHTNVGFRVRHMMVSTVQGYFRKFSGTVLYDEKAPEKTQLDVTIDAASVDTNMPQRDEHLRSDDFFAAAKFPALTFKSKKTVVAGEDHLKITGDLTIRGITREVTLDVSSIGPEVKDPWGGFRRGATAVGKLDRREFDLKWNAALEAGGVLVSDEVKLQLDVELIKKS